MSQSNQPHVEINMTKINNSHTGEDIDEPDLGGRRSRNPTTTHTNTPHRTLSPSHIPTLANRDRSPIRRSRNNPAIREPEHDALLETEEFDPRQPPMAGPEIDDDGVDDDIPFTPEARPGVDDGFFPAPEEPRHRNNGSNNNNNNNNRNNNNNGHRDPEFGTRAGNEPNAPPTFPNNGSIPRNNQPGRRQFPPFPMIPMDDNEDVPRIIPDVNVYQQKKTLASGMMDLALLSANANQLRYVIETFAHHPFSYVSMFFIGISVVFQIAVGVGLILNSRYNVKNEDDICKADRINNLTVIGIFIITVVNVFVAAFGIPLPVVQGTT